MKAPKFTEEQLEYLNGLLNGDLNNEIWKKENADTRNRMDFRMGQRDGIRMAMRAIIVDQEQQHSANVESTHGTRDEK